MMSHQWCRGAQIANIEGRKDLEHLVGKLRPMHLAVTGALADLFHIQPELNQVGVDRVWLSTAFHRKLADLKALAL